MQAIRSFHRSSDRAAWLRAVIPGAMVRLAVQLDQSIRRPPVGALLIQQLLA